MLDAAEDARRFSTGRKREGLDQDRMLVLSLSSASRSSEAASRVSDTTQAEIPSLPWADIVGMRNRLIHAYYDVDHDRVWDTVVEDLPMLIQARRDYLD